MVDTDRLLKQQQAELLKNSLDSLYALRNQLAPYTPEDAKLFVLAIEALQNLRDHLELTQEFPRWSDVWDARRGWEPSSK